MKLDLVRRWSNETSTEQLARQLDFTNAPEDVRERALERWQANISEEEQAVDEEILRARPGYNEWKAVVMANPNAVVIPKGGEGDEQFASVSTGARFMDAEGNWYTKT